MVVFLLFNKSFNWTVEQMQDETQIKIELLLEVLCALLKSKLLTCAQLNNEEFKESDIQMDYKIQLANAFKR
jgi:cullin 1